jgi:hypothetical protein
MQPGNPIQPLQRFLRIALMQVDHLAVRGFARTFNCHETPSIPINSDNLIAICHNDDCQKRASLLFATMGACQHQ